MKRIELNSVFPLIGKFKLNKVVDKAAAMKIVKLHMALYKPSQEAEKDREELVKKVFEGHEEELQNFQQGNREGLNEDFYTLVNQFDSLYNEMMGKEVEINLTPLTLDEFVGALEGQDFDITSGDIAVLQTLGIITL